MHSTNAVDRREFVALSASGLAAAGLANSSLKAAEQSNAALAIEGGPKQVSEKLAQVSRWGDAERERLDMMLEQESLFYWKGPQTKYLIEQFQKTCPLKFVQTCSSGTAALHIALAAAGIGPGDEVITTPITDMGTVIGALFQQGVPVFADLDPRTYNLDVDDVARKLGPRTKAIIAVHLAGNPCDMAALKALATRAGIVLIEDCAQAWGARWKDQPIGTLGDIACFSLQQSKHVTCGDGGIVASNDDRFGQLLQPYGDKGMDRVRGGGLFHSFATNYRMSEPQAAVASAQLGRLESIAERRTRCGNLLGEVLVDVPGIQPHGINIADRCTYWFYMLRLQPHKFRCQPAEFVKALVAEGVPASAGYIPVPLYGNPIFQNHSFFGGRWPIKEFGLTAMDYSTVSCPVAEAILKDSVRVTINENMSDAFIRSVGEAIKKVARHYWR